VIRIIGYHFEEWSGRAVVLPHAPPRRVCVCEHCGLWPAQNKLVNLGQSLWFGEFVADVCDKVDCQNELLARHLL